jgi:hypothetical protein
MRRSEGWDYATPLMRKGNFKSIPTVMPHAREDEMMDAAELSRLSEIAARAARVGGAQVSGKVRGLAE